MSDPLAAPFELFGVVHLVRPAGFDARNLEELRAGLDRASPSTLFHHAFEGMLRHPSSRERPPDDFSHWVNGVVQERETAERLSFAVQAGANCASELRGALIEVLDALPRSERLERAAPEAGRFVFLETESVPLETGWVVHTCEELMARLAEADASVLFYHLIEQPWLEPDLPSLSTWVRTRGEAKLAAWMVESSHSGRPLEKMRRRLVRRWKRSRLSRRLAKAAVAPEQRRREEGRRVISGLVRRIRRPEG
jgi:hypothetical protein